MFPLTDHFPVFYTFKENCLGIIKTIQFRLINNDTKAAFVNLVEALDFHEVYDTRPLNVAFEIFFTKLFEIYNSAFPIKKKRMKNNLINAPWVTPQLKRCIKKKFALFNLLRRGLIQRQTFNKYKNLLPRMKRNLVNCRGDHLSTLAAFHMKMSTTKEVHDSNVRATTAEW